MKTEQSHFHCEAVEILSKPGRFLVVSQYVSGGFLSTDDNGGRGYSASEASDEVVALNTIYHARSRERES